jgi:sec-independent protein translocase protein TatC
MMEAIKPSKSIEDMPEMGLFDHLRELRKCIFISLAAVIIGACIAYSFSTPIFTLLAEPYFRAFPNNTLIGTGPAEAFLLKLKMAIFGGVLIVAPVIFHQLWMFIAPGLYSHEKKMVIPFVLATTILFLGGVVFCYSLVLPLAFAFFAQQYQSIGVTPTVKISEHLTFIAEALLGFGFVFELPAVAFVLGRIGVIDERTLIDAGRYAIVGIFVVAAIFTPPDVLSQFLMAVPLLILYGLSIIIVKYTCKKREQ